MLKFWTAKSNMNTDILIVEKDGVQQSIDIPDMPIGVAPQVLFDYFTNKIKTAGILPATELLILNP